MGHYAAGGRAVVPVDECPVHSDRANRIAFRLRDELARARVPAAGADLSGVLRHLIIRTSADDRDAVAMLVVTRNAASLAQAGARAARLGRPARRLLRERPRPPVAVHGRAARRCGSTATRTCASGAWVPRSWCRRRRSSRPIPPPRRRWWTSCSRTCPREATRVLDLYAGSGLFSCRWPARGHQRDGRGREPAGRRRRHPQPRREPDRSRAPCGSSAAASKTRCPRFRASVRRRGARSAATGLPAGRARRGVHVGSRPSAPSTCRATPTRWPASCRQILARRLRGDGGGARGHVSAHAARGGRGRPRPRARPPRDSDASMPRRPMTTAPLAPLRPAATVIVLRPAAEAPFDVLLVRRNDQVAFMAGAYVFPGGRVDDTDAPEPVEACDGLDTLGRCGRPDRRPTKRATAWPPSASCSKKPACCWRAARTVMADAATAAACAPRRRRARRSWRIWRPRACAWPSMRSCRLRTGSRPEIEIRRYDTRFLLARVPDGQNAVARRRRDDGARLAERRTRRSRVAQRGEIMLPPPTWTTLTRLAKFDVDRRRVAVGRRRTPIRAHRSRCSRGDGGTTVADAAGRPGLSPARQAASRSRTPASSWWRAAAGGRCGVERGACRKPRAGGDYPRRCVMAIIGRRAALKLGLSLLAAGAHRPLALAQAQAVAGPARFGVLAELEGQWEGTGVILGQASRVQMEWARALDAPVRAAHLREPHRPGTQDAAVRGPRLLPAGGRRPLSRHLVRFERPRAAHHRHVHRSALVAAWGTADTEVGETTYRLAAPDRMEVVDRVQAEGRHVAGIRPLDALAYTTENDRAAGRRRRCRRPARLPRPPLPAGETPAEPTASLPPPPRRGSSVRGRFVFTGTGGEYFRIWIVNLLLSVSRSASTRRGRRCGGCATSTATRRWTAARSATTPSPIAILKGRLIAYAVVLVLAVLGQVAPLAASALYLPLLMLMPIVLVRAFRFRAANSSYGGIRFGFDGLESDAYRVFLFWPMTVPVHARPGLSLRHQAAARVLREREPARALAIRARSCPLDGVYRIYVLAASGDARCGSWSARPRSSARRATRRHPRPRHHRPARA